MFGSACAWIGQWRVPGLTFCFTLLRLPTVARRESRVRDGRFAENWRNLQIATPRAGYLAEILIKVTNATIFRFDTS